MDLEQLDRLPSADQWTFVRGKIAEASVTLDAALRALHAQLRGLNTREALLSASQNWTLVADQCRTMIADVDDELLPVANRIRQEGDYYLLRLTRKANTPAVTLVTLDGAR